MPVIKVENLSKEFDRRVVLDHITFAVRHGEILGLLGPNGAGKTTTIGILLGLITPTRGCIRIFGLDLRKHRREILARVNFSSAYTALPANLTVWENLFVFARLYGIYRPEKKIDALLELFEIPETAKRVAGSLSSGQLTRLNLCKAFLNDPEVLFLDEPTASLDPDIAAKVRERLMGLQRERQVTMIYTSHNMQEVESMCDRVIFLARGRMVMEGPPKEIVAASRTRSLEDLFIAIARNGHLYELDQKNGEAECG